jgi:phospholipid-transporting ATPase
MLDAPVNMFAQIFIKMGNWILLFGNFVPISLMLTLETVKFMQGNLMSIDQGLVSYHGIPCKV